MCQEAFQLYKCGCIKRAAIETCDLFSALGKRGCKIKDIVEQKLDEKCGKHTTLGGTHLIDHLKMADEYSDHYLPPRRHVEPGSSRPKAVRPTRTHDKPPASMRGFASEYPQPSASRGPPSSGQSSTRNESDRRESSSRHESSASHYESNSLHGSSAFRHESKAPRYASGYHQDSSGHRPSTSHHESASRYESSASHASTARPPSSSHPQEPSVRREEPDALRLIGYPAAPSARPSSSARRASTASTLRPRSIIADLPVAGSASARPSAPLPAAMDNRHLAAQREASAVSQSSRRHSVSGSSRNDLSKAPSSSHGPSYYYTTPKK